MRVLKKGFQEHWKTHTHITSFSVFEDESCRAGKREKVSP